MTPFYDNLRYSPVRPSHWSYPLMVVVVLLLTLAGLYAAYQMEHEGHHITGMNNHIVWGLPHVFAISLIVTASGALNGASLASVFGQQLYKPYSRISIVLAICLLIGGLTVLVLDLGRPDRLIIAMTHYNFRSIFTWNIFLYTGFVLIGAVYLWMLMERKMNRYVARVGVVAFVWRIVLTTGTGCIFGFLVGRNALDSALMAPMFIALSLAMGTALLALALMLISFWQQEKLKPAVQASLERLMLWFLIAVVYFSVVHHLTNLYVAEHHAVERYTLLGSLAPVFWVGHIFLGIIAPVALILLKPIKSGLTRLSVVSLLSLVGGVALIYVIVIGSQSTPQRLFPGHTVVSSRFGDAGFAPYQASFWEWALGFGGVAIAVLACLLLLRTLAFSPINTHSDE